MLGKLLYLNLLVMTMLALPSVRAEAENSCANFLIGKQGTLYGQTAQGKFFLLGQGAVGKVFRFVRPDGRKEIHKVYRSRESLRSDLASLNFFREVIATLGVADDLGVSRVLRVEDDDLTVIFEDQWGQTLKDVVTTGLGAEELRSEWKNRYIIARDRINQYIIERHKSQLVLSHFIPFDSPVFSIQLFTMKKSADYLCLALKPSNVLVTQEGKLILFDPY